VTRTLSEPDSKALLASYGVPCVEHRLVTGADSAVAAAYELGLPVVAKLAGSSIAHKTERGLVRLGLGTAAQVAGAAEELLAAARGDDGEVQVLVAPMIRGVRELIVGVHRDPQFGSCVMVGIGGVLAEANADVAFRLVPIEPVDAREMLEQLAGQPLLGALRGEAPVDQDAVARVIVALSRLAEERADVISADVNPLLVDRSGSPIAVDALVVTSA
jgi:succinyl-CoA synthetase beta subunit